MKEVIEIGLPRERAMNRPEFGGYYQLPENRRSVEVEISTPGDGKTYFMGARNKAGEINPSVDDTPKAGTYLFAPYSGGKGIELWKLEVVYLS